VWPTDLHGSGNCGEKEQPREVLLQEAESGPVRATLALVITQPHHAQFGQVLGQGRCTVHAQAVEGNTCVVTQAERVPLSMQAWCRRSAFSSTSTWSGVEWSGVEWSGVEWSGVEWSGVEWTWPS
jgi:hypothetical protein